MEVEQLKKEEIGVVIMNHNRQQMLQECLFSLIKNTDVDCQIVVVDWKSKDSSRSWLASMESTGFVDDLFLDDSNMGYAECNNFYVKRFPKWKYFFLVNNDMKVYPGWLESALKVMLHDPTIGVVAPQVIRGNLIQVMSHGANFDVYGNTVIPGMNKHPNDSYFDSINGRKFAYAGFQLYRKDLYEALNHLDFPPGAPIYWDDSDYGMKVNAAGFKIQFENTSKVVHLMHLDENRQHHANWLQIGREWFYNRWGNFLTAHNGFDPNVNSVRPLFGKEQLPAELVWPGIVKVEGYTCP